MKINEEFFFPPWGIGFKIGKPMPSPLRRMNIQIPSEEEVERGLYLYEKLMHLRDNNREALLSLPYTRFMKIADSLKVTGEIVEAYFFKGLKKLDPSFEIGDRKHENGKTFQFKESFIWHSKRDASFRRIQKWHEVDEYILVIIDKTCHYRPYFFVLTKDQMIKELKLLNARANDATKEANTRNRRIPLSFSINCSESNPHFTRWMNSYRRTDMEKKYLDEINETIKSSKTKVLTLQEETV